MFLWIGDDDLTVHWTPHMKTYGHPIGYLTVRYLDRRPSLDDLALVGAAFFADETRVIVLRSDPEALALIESTTGRRMADLAVSAVRRLERHLVVRV